MNLRGIARLASKTKAPSLSVINGTSIEANNNLVVHLTQDNNSEEAMGEATVSDTQNKNEKKFIDLEQKIFESGVASYACWLELGGQSLVTEVCFAGIGEYDIKEKRIFFKEHIKQGVLLDDGLRVNVDYEFIIDEAKKERAKSILIDRFPQINNILTKQDDLEANAMLHSILSYEFDDKVKNPFTEQVEAEKIVIEMFVKKSLNTDESAVESRALAKTTKANDYWKDRTFSNWLKTEASDFLTKAQIEALIKSI